MKLILLIIPLFLLLESRSGEIKDWGEKEVTTPNIEVDNPYKGVNWEKAIQIRSTSHIHITDQAGLDKAVRIGYRHLPISNY